MYERKKEGEKERKKDRKKKKQEEQAAHEIFIKSNYGKDTHVTLIRSAKKHLAATLTPVLLFKSAPQKLMTSGRVPFQRA